MFKLFEKSEISGTCWVEFNISGNSNTFQHWHDSSRYASLDAMDEVYKVFTLCIKGFDLYRPIFIDDRTAKQLSTMLDAFASTTTKRSASRFASDLSYFIRESVADEKCLWMLGV